MFTENEVAFMNLHGGHTRSYVLLGILQSYAPDNNAQARCAQVYRDACGEGADENTLARTMSQALSDGLTHGNWPWTI